MGGLTFSFRFLEIYTLEDDNEELIQYVKEIKARLGIWVLYVPIATKPCGVNIYRPSITLRYITVKELALAPQFEVIGEENTGRVDYAIKALEELICITEWKLHQMVMGFTQNLIVSRVYVFLDDFGIVTTAKRRISHFIR